MKKDILKVGRFRIHPYKNGHIQVVPLKGEVGENRDGPFPTVIFLSVDIIEHGREKITRHNVPFFLPDKTKPDLFLKKSRKVGQVPKLSLGFEEDPNKKGVIIQEGWP